MEGINDAVTPGDVLVGRLPAPEFKVVSILFNIVRFPFARFGRTVEGLVVEGQRSRSSSPFISSHHIRLSPITVAVTIDGRRGLVASIRVIVISVGKR